MSEAAIITTALEEIKGSGIISVGQDVNVDVDFVLQILKNGKGIGTISLKTIRQDIFNHIKQNYFSLNGRVGVSGDKLIAGDCRMTSVTEIGGKLTFQSLEIFPKSLDTKPQKELYLHASVLNMYQTRNVSVETSIGQLLLRHYEGIEQSENIMRMYDTPLVTSFLQISMLPDGNESISDISVKGIQTTEAFLKITSLYQMVWHEWATIGIYEKDAEKLLLFKFSTPGEKIPVYSPLGDRYYANEFINAAWKGYSKDHEIKYNFDSALEWFIGSNSGASLEPQYLCATTCLEMLMDKFHTQNMTEFLLDEITFDELYEAIKDAAKTFLKSKGIDSKLRRSIYGALKGCNRRAYVEKFSMLLENWNVTTQDFRVILNEIKEIRDKITHEGRYTLYNQEQLQHVMITYKDLMSILAKVFLAMLNFKKGYHDPWQDHWISEPT